MQNPSGNRRMDALSAGSHNSIIGSGFRNGNSLFSDFFNRDPFDDPFFTQPFGSFSSSTDDFFEPFQRHSGRPSDRRRQDAQQQQSPRGPVIEELLEDNEDADAARSKSSQKPIVEHPDDVGTPYYSSSTHERERDIRPNNFFQSYSFTSARYGGPRGTYYKSSTTRRTGADGLIEEEHEERDSTTGQETNQILRGLGNKGHAVTHKRDATGSENYVETLHNLTEEEKTEFDDTWRRQAEKYLPGWSKGHGRMLANDHFERARQKAVKAALPSTKETTWRWPWAKKA